MVYLSNTWYETQSHRTIHSVKSGKQYTMICKQTGIGTQEIYTVRANIHMKMIYNVQQTSKIYERTNNKQGITSIE